MAKLPVKSWDLNVVHIFEIFLLGRYENQCERLKIFSVVFQDSRKLNTAFKV